MMECLEKPKTLNAAGIVSLAEAVIFQSISDLWNGNQREKSLKFFKGEGFLKYADLAGMCMSDRRRLFEMLDKALKREHTPCHVFPSFRLVRNLSAGVNEIQPRR